MDEKTKLVVFDRKEVFLLFCLVSLAAVTSFVFGVKVGKNYSYERAGFTSQDRMAVDLMSKEEEEANRAVKESSQGVAPISSTEETLKRLEEEFNQIGGTKEVEKEPELPEIREAEQASKTQESSKDEGHPLTKPTGLEGKFTIQLGSYPSLDDAKQFAEGFKIRGYNPYVHEVKLDGKGTWYRVSLGLFQNAQEARDYIKQEESLFQGQDYVITDIK